MAVSKSMKIPYLNLIERIIEYKNVKWKVILRDDFDYGKFLPNEKSSRYVIMRSVTTNSLQYPKSLSTFMKKSSNHDSIKMDGDKRTVSSD